jgi:hypothetical protein
MEICEICMYKKNLITIKPCNHNMCKECYFKIMKLSETKVCPFCREKITNGILTKKHIQEFYYINITKDEIKKQINKAIINQDNFSDSSE